MSGSNRKFGRNKKRPSSMRYTQTQRWISNKAKAIKRHARCMATKAIRRIQWEVRKGKTTLQASAARLTELRQVVAQNRTG